MAFRFITFRSEIFILNLAWSTSFSGFFSLLLRANFIDLVKLSDFYLSHIVDGKLNFLTLIIAGLFGGLLGGIAIALTF